MTIRVGVLGTGMIAQLLADQCKEIPEIKLTGVYDIIDEAYANAYADKNEISNIYTDYDALLKAADVDTIYTGIPNSLHYPYAKKALQAGKNVIIEKPFASNIREFDDLIRTAAVNKVKIVEVTRVLTLPNYQVIKASLSLLGHISLVMISTCQYSRKYNAYLDGQMPNVFSAEFSGGALMDLGVYGLHFMTDLFGMPERINYTANQLPNTIDISGVLNLTYNGFVAALAQSKNSFSDYFVTIQGEKGTILVDDIVSKCRKVYLLIKDERKLISVPQEHENFYYSLIDILKILNDDERYQKSTEHSRMVMEIIDQARSSGGIVFAADNKAL